MSAATVNERLAALTAAGTSVWLDSLRRSLITTGELERLVTEYSLRGVTSNPAIFEAAILGSPDYDDELVRLSREGLDGRELYRRLAIDDVRMAADVLRPVYDESEGADGFVSLEVDPDLAFESDRTLEQARMYWERVDRPNLMVKIPGTLEGVPAIEQAIAEGININVTLLFGVEAYTEVAEAYLRGLERRRDAGGDLASIASVASFFVSRVDTEVDHRLARLGREDLRGKAGLANARAAYRRFKEIFGSERFAALAEAGARVQRPLWASTGVKDPAYPDTLYVDGLVGPDTVNTMPMATLLAAADHADVQGATAAIHPGEDLAALADAGIDLRDVTGQLVREGVDKFVAPMDKLLAGIESKREAVVTSRPRTIESSIPDALEQPIADAVKRAQAEDVARRIWRRDDTLWGPPGQPEVADRLGWLTSTETMREQVDDLRDFVAGCASDGLTDAVLLGMGGSSLAPEVFRRSFPAEAGPLRLHVLDSTDANAVAAVEARVPLEATLFVVSSKSGGTIETLSQFRWFWEKIGRGEQFCAITDPGSGLARLAEEHGFRRTFLNDPEIGGRYSALSYFGLVPAALMGASVPGLLDRAGVAEQASVSFDTSAANSGLWLGLTLGALAAAGRDKLTLLASPPIESVGLWLEQLVAESLGKQGRGILPVADEPLIEAAGYGDDRVFAYLRNVDEPDPELERAAGELARAGHPILTLQVHGPTDLGRIFFFAEFATAVAGWVLGVNPFDQPNVQEAKDNTAKVLDALPLPAVEDASDEALGELLRAQPPSYLAILAYVEPTEAFDAAAAELREVLLQATGCATTFGYGPRFQHSTGQLHKGGPPTGRFLQLFHHARAGMEIPGAGYDFETLKGAQALGDLRTLRDHGLPAERVTLAGDDPAAALRELTATIRKVL